LPAMTDRIEELEADVVAAEAKADWWQELAEALEADVTRAIQTALEMAAQEAQANAGRFDVHDRIRDIPVKYVLARMEGEP